MGNSDEALRSVADSPTRHILFLYNVKEMRDVHRVEPPDMPTKEQQDCIDACNSCIITANACLAIRIGEEAMVDCLMLCLDCTDLCGVCVKLLAGDSQFANRVCGICADACDQCATECDKFDSPECKACAEACRACAEQCQQMSSSA